MKILVSAYSCNPAKGGEANYSFHWAYQYATRASHDVWCIVQPAGKKEIEAFLEKNPVPNLHFVYLPAPDWARRLYEGSHFGVIVHYWVWQQMAYQKARELNGQVDFDFLHHVSYGSLQLGTALWKLNKPLIFGPIGGGQFAPPAFKRYFMRWWKMELSRYWVSKLTMLANPNVNYAVKEALAVLVTNQETFELAGTMKPRHMQYSLDSILPDDFYPATYPERTPSDTLRLLWVGSVMARKGLLVVLEALAKVRPEVKYHLTIQGDGPMGSYVPDWIKENNLEGKVTWSGKVPWTEVKRAYAENDVFMFCTLRDSFAAQFLEAMAYGLPIITLNHHGARTFVPEGVSIKAPVVKPEETLRRLAEAVEYMYQHPKERAEMGKKAYEFAKTQSWSHKLDSVLSLVKEKTTSI